MVIARYITKEIFSTFSAITFILLFIALSNKFVMFLAKAASGKLPVTLVFKVVGLYIPELFGILAPVAMFIAILFTHSRLHADSEVAVLLTCGYDWAKLCRSTLIIASIIAALVAVLNIFIVPSITEQREKLVADGQVAGVMHAITPGQFQTIDDNDQLVFYVENVLPGGQLRNIFIAQQPNPEKADTDKSIVVVTAQTADIKQLDNKNEFYLILRNGYRYMGTPGTANYTVISFAEYGRELKYASGPLPSYEYIRPSSQLFNSKSPLDVAEFQWRCSMPLAVIILALLAIPLAKVQPRQGRYAKFLPAVLIYMVYYNLLTVDKRWIANGTLSSFPGIWAVHILFLIFALVLLFKVSGRWNELKYNRKLAKQTIIENIEIKLPT
jgi:lipopolysaccharide export system permease protein